MAQIKTEKEYEAAMARIDELLPLTWGDNVPEDSPENIELSLLRIWWRSMRTFIIR